MSEFCEDCPASEYIGKNFKPTDQSLAVNVAQGLSGQFVNAVRGTKGLTDERIDEIRVEEIESWGDSEEARVLADFPELTRAVYECEEKVTVLGSCVLHSTMQKKQS
ncbi:MAG: hypothetical protein U0491_01495 [Candidatus Saccharimonadales bacterium]